MSTFKKKLLNFMRPTKNSIFNCHDPKGIKLLTRLLFGFSHFSDDKFRHELQDTLNPFCSCGNDTESTYHYILHCPQYSNRRIILIVKIKDINKDILNQNDEILVQTLIPLIVNFLS